ncbi:MAG TPA: hypothetical protein VE075_01910 [Thermoanaerobaculia bacterium]|nr:hypothetical protein [Thermoanaerobaculia bacterium]
MSEAFLVLRRDGATWAVARPAVQGLARRGAAFEVKLAAGALSADEVVAVTADLRWLPVGGVLRRFWPEAAHGLAVHGAVPVVLIDPLAPPRSLLAAAARGAVAEPSSAAYPPRAPSAGSERQKGDADHGN